MFFPQPDEGTCGTYKINFLQEGLFKEIAFKIMSVSHTKYKKMTSIYLLFSILRSVYKILMRLIV